MKKTRNVAVAKKWFVINLFGESHSGKTTILKCLINLLRAQSRCAVDLDSDKVDQKSLTWHCNGGGKQLGSVCVCTAGDTEPVVVGNVGFFKQAMKRSSPWNFLVCNVPGSVIRSVAGFCAILVMASRKPLSAYKNLEIPPGCEVVNFPVRVDGWHAVGVAKIGSDWMSSVRMTPEVLLFHVNYILRKGGVKQYNGKLGHRVSVKAMRASVSRDN